jgi:hypothetical protein
MAKGPPVCACGLPLLSDIRSAQLQPTAVSIAANIAARFTNRAKTRQLRFSSIAQGLIEKSQY